MSTPLFVVPNKNDAASVTRLLAGQGWKIQSGDQLPSQPWDVSLSRLVITTVISSQDGVAQAVLAAARGAGVIAISAQQSSLTQALISDLARIGVVHQSAVEAKNTTTGSSSLDAEHGALLERLARGESIAAAAEAEFLSLRTANRRLAEARRRLGVGTTREAVVEYVRRNARVRGQN